MARRKETIATVTFARRPGWRYWPCVEANGEVVILGGDGRRVARTRFENIPGSSYELVGTRVIRRFDTKHEAKAAAKHAARDAKLARLRAPAFATRVAAFAKKLRSTASIVDTDDLDDLVTAVVRIRVRRGTLALDWLLSDEAALAGGFVFARETTDRDHIAELGIVPSEDAADIVRLVQTGGAADPDELARTIAAIPSARIMLVSNSVLAFRLLTPCKAIAKHARALDRLDSFAETTVADLRAQLKRGDVHLWWD
jgi:hypothetical protein